ncbi:MAG: ABC-type transport auxiliary lipoprotein family protein [Parasphingopyxis sp.]|nr:ABC-type transport auxiliary lipoprotein family protein [Sphingomonadales bacterium]
MRLWPALLMLLALPGCISFGEDPPPFLLTLTPGQTVEPGTSRAGADGRSITIAEPQIPQKLSTNRLAVTTGETTVSYFPDAIWADTPNALFRDLVGEVVAARTGRIVLDPRQYSSSPGLIVNGQLREFGYDSRSRQVVIVYEAVIDDEVGGIRTRRFEASEPVAVEEAQYLAQALNSAANRVAAEVSDWVAG